MNKMNSKLYLGYDYAVIFYTKMGVERFISFLEKHQVITMDKECYYFLLTVQDEYKKFIK